jgi:hypothetical protein
MSNSHRARPQLEPMEGRALMSAGTSGALSGVVRGTYQLAVTGNNELISFTGSGAVRPLGAVSATGTLGPVGSQNANGSFPGQFKLSGTKGADTVDLFRLVGSLRLTFVGSTPSVAGAYRVLTLTETGGSTAPGKVGHGLLTVTRSGHFTLAIG